MLTRETSLFIHALLIRADLTDTDVRHLIGAAKRWLDAHESINVTGFTVVGVLATAIRRADVDPDFTARAVQLGVRWLEEYPEEPIGGMVASMLLSHKDLNQDSARAVADRALFFVAHQGKDRDAFMLLLPLLERGHFELHPKDRAMVTRAALAWVERHVDIGQAHHVLSALIAHSRLNARDTGMLRLLMLRWLGKHGPVPGSEAITTFLLGAPSLSERRAQADVPVTNELVDLVRSVLKTDAFVSACQAIPALLAMVACTDDETTLRRARKLVWSAIRDPRVGEDLRTEMVAGCRRLVDANVWPHPERVWRFLSKLDLKPS